MNACETDLTQPHRLHFLSKLPSYSLNINLNSYEILEKQFVFAQLLNIHYASWTRNMNWMVSIYWYTKWLFDRAEFHVSIDCSYIYSLSIDLYKKSWLKRVLLTFCICCCVGNLLKRVEERAEYKNGAPEKWKNILR